MSRDDLSDDDLATRLALLGVRSVELDLDFTVDSPSPEQVLERAAVEMRRFVSEMEGPWGWLADAWARMTDAAAGDLCAEAAKSALDREDGARDLLEDSTSVDALTEAVTVAARDLRRSLGELELGPSLKLHHMSTVRIPGRGGSLRIRVLDEHPPGAVTLSRETTPPTVITPHGPALALDVAGAAFLDSITPGFGDDVVKSACDRWRQREASPGLFGSTQSILWAWWRTSSDGEPPRFLSRLARAVLHRDRETLRQSYRKRRSALPRRIVDLFADPDALEGARVRPVSELPAEAIERLPERFAADALLVLAVFANVIAHEKIQVIPGHAPIVTIPAGVKLAEAAGAPLDGATKAALDAAVEAIAALRIRVPGYAEVATVWQANRTAPSPGRPGTWELTLGPALRTPLAWKEKEPSHARRPWQQLSPLPDRVPDLLAWNRNRRRDAARLVWHMLSDWRSAAGHKHGRPWLERPGMDIATFIIRAEALGLNPTIGLDRWGEDEWITLDGDRLRPGPMLPRVSSLLDDAARDAQKKVLDATKGKKRLR